MRGRVAGLDASPSLRRISSLCLVMAAGAPARSRSTSSWSEASSTTSAVVGSPITSGRGQPGGVGGQHAGHIESDVAVANDDDPLVAEIDWQLSEIGMPVDPGDQLGS